MSAEAPVRRIALVQQRASDDPESNLSRAEAAIRSAASQGARIVCLPELFRTRYFPQEEQAQWFDLAETVPGATTERLAKLAADRSVVLIVPVFERRAPGLYHNTAVVLDANGSIAGIYRKMHVPDDPRFFEKFYFAPGDTGFRAFDTRAGRLGVCICWDQWFPESARLTALDGAEILFYPSAIAWIPGDSEEESRAQRESWITIQRAHAIANGVFVAAVNRVGNERDLRFYGSSFVADPQGRLLAEAPVDRDSVLVVDCPLERIERQRRGWPFLRDRRVDAYGDLLARFRR
jgi:N-carbamoylputrescine amidase